MQGSRAATASCSATGPFTGLIASTWCSQRRVYSIVRSIELEMTCKPVRPCSVTKDKHVQSDSLHTHRLCKTVVQTQTWRTSVACSVAARRRSEKTLRDVLVKHNDSQHGAPLRLEPPLFIVTLRACGALWHCRFICIFVGSNFKLRF